MELIWPLLAAAGCLLVLGTAAAILHRWHRRVLHAAAETSRALEAHVEQVRSERALRDQATVEASARTAQLVELTRDFTAALDEAHVLEALTRDAHQLLTPRATVAWTVGPTAEPILAFRVGDAPETARPPWHVVRALRSGHATREERRDGSLDLALPLWAGGGCAGILDVRGVKADTVDLIDGLHVLVAHAATAVTAARLQSTSTEAGLRDALTGAANGRRLEEDLATEVSLARRAAGPLAYVHVAVDQLRSYAERHGTRAGDDALIDVVALMRASCRGSDTVYRLGGDEFVLLLRGSDAESGAQLAERLRSTVEKQLAGRGLTVSAGVAAVPEHASTTAALTEAATTALGDAKSDGGNCVVVAPRSTGSAEVVPLPGLS